MSHYAATILWETHPHEKFIDHQYSRAHIWEFDGGISISASSSPQIVPTPYSNAENVDPEEAFIAAISSCHMLFFLDLAAQNTLKVERYVDAATGVLGKDETGNIAMLSITLAPKITWSEGHSPNEELIAQLHHQAHTKCFLANSIKTEINITT